MTIEEQTKLLDTVREFIHECKKSYTLWMTTLPYTSTGIYDPKIIKTANPIDGVMIHLLDGDSNQEIYIFINDEDKVKPVINLLKPIDTWSRKASNLYFDIIFYIFTDLYAALRRASECSKENNPSIDVALPDDYDPEKRCYRYCGGYADFFKKRDNQT